MTGVLLMNEAQTPFASHDFESAGQPGAGALIKQAREASGLHIAALAVLLKVPVKKLEALESDRFDLLPDIVFARALAFSVCRSLKIDPLTILSSLPETHLPKLTFQGLEINEPFRSPGDRPGPSIWAHVSRRGILAGVLLLVGSLVLIFLPTIKSGIGYISREVRSANFKGIDPEKAMAVSPVADVPLVVLDTPVASVVVPGLASQTTTTSAGVVQTPLVAKSLLTVAASGQLLTPELRGLTAVESPTTFAVAVNSPSTAEVVVFTAKNESWVEAIDAKGLVVLRRNLVAGEIVGASGVLPLKVIVGRANATQVEIRGKMFDALAIAKDNVARFEVK